MKPHFTPVETKHNCFLLSLLDDSTAILNEFKKINGVDRVKLLSPTLPLTFDILIENNGLVRGQCEVKYKTDWHFLTYEYKINLNNFPLQIETFSILF